MKRKVRYLINIALVSTTLLFIVQQFMQASLEDSKKLSQVEAARSQSNVLPLSSSDKSRHLKLKGLKGVGFKPTQPGNSSYDEVLKEAKQRATTLRDNCHKYANQVRKHIPRKWNSFKFISPTLYMNVRYHLIYCLVYKAGSTHWRKLFQVFEGKQKDMNFTFKDMSLNQVNPIYATSTHTRLLIFRDPLDRLLSCYRDKIQPLGPHNASFVELNTKILESNNNEGDVKFEIKHPTFEQFVKFVLSDNTKMVQKRTWEPMHWMDYLSSCGLCKADYDYIITMENASAESNALLRKIGAPKNLKYPPPYTNQSHKEIYNKYYSELSDDLYEKLCRIYSLDYLLFGIPCPSKPII